MRAPKTIRSIALIATKIVAEFTLALILVVFAIQFAFGGFEYLGRDTYIAVLSFAGAILFLVRPVYLLVVVVRMVLGFRHDPAP